MKKIFSFILLATFTLSVNAQRYMSVTQKDGSVTEYALSAIDSIHFFVKDNTTPEPPVTNPNPDDPFENGHEYVDLGLPSGTLWATCNVGATSPEDYGDYFAWGETTFKSEYSLETYKWYTIDTIVESDSDGFETITYKKGYTKYCSGYEDFTDTLKTLELADDAAHVNWGGSWRMPTNAEFEELLNNCTWEWKTLNGVNGYKVTSNVEGNTNYIFLPAAGYHYNWHSDYTAGKCYFWSSSLYEGLPYKAYYIQCGSGEHYTHFDSRCNGLSVRPVCSSNLEYDNIEGKRKITIAEAIEIGNTLDGNSTSADQYILKGIVTMVQEASTRYGNFIFEIKDESSEAEFMIYRVYYLHDEKYTTDDPALEAGDEVVIVGQIINYNGTLQLVNGYIKEHNK